MDPTRLIQNRLSQVNQQITDRLSQIALPTQAFSDILSGKLASPQREGIAYIANMPDNLNTYISAPAGSSPAAAAASSGSAAAMSARKAQYAPLVARASAKYGVPVNLINAVIQTESSFRPDAVSSAGAQGLMQLMPGTAKEVGVTDPFDPAQSIDGGVQYLKKLLDRFNGDTRLAVAAYNCGPNRVSSLGITSSADASQFARLSTGVQGYVNKVMGYMGYTATA